MTLENTFFFGELWEKCKKLKVKSKSNNNT